MENITKRKMTDTALNVWVKKLNRLEKKLFYNRLFANKLLMGSRDKKQKWSKYDNFRYVEVSRPSKFDAILIYVTALYIDPDLKIKTLFPDLHESYYIVLLPHLKKLSLETNNFNRDVENKEN